MKIQIFFLILIAIQNSYIFSEDTPLRSTAEALSASSDWCAETSWGIVFKKPYHCLTLTAGCIAGAATTLVGNLICGEYCTYSFPFNTTTRLAAFTGNVLFGTSVEVAGGALIGTALTGAAIVGYRRFSKPRA
jgi:hypothetical protein